MKEIFDYRSYRLSLLQLKLSNLKATVTYQKGKNIRTFDCFELMPYGQFLDKTKNNCCVHNRLVFNRNKRIFYISLTNTQKSIYIYTVKLLLALGIWTEPNLVTTKPGLFLYGFVVWDNLTKIPQLQNS